MAAAALRLLADGPGDGSIRSWFRQKRSGLGWREEEWREEDGREEDGTLAGSAHVLSALRPDPAAALVQQRQDAAHGERNSLGHLLSHHHGNFRNVHPECSVQLDGGAVNGNQKPFRQEVGQCSAGLSPGGKLVMALAL